jgi:hypothetical protein
MFLKDSKSLKINCGNVADQESQKCQSTTHIQNTGFNATYFVFMLPAISNTKLD